MRMLMSGLRLMVWFIVLMSVASASKPRMLLADVQGTETATPTVTETLAPTATLTDTPVATESPSSTATATDTPAATQTESASATATDTAVPTATEAATTPTNTPVPTETQTASEIPTDTPVPTETATVMGVTPTDTPVSVQTGTATAASTETSTPAVTVSPTARITVTPGSPFLAFLFAASGTQPVNEQECAVNLADTLGFTYGADMTFQFIATHSDPAVLRNTYQVIYVAPGLNSDDYAFLRNLVQPEGVIEQFVNMGGVAVINVAGTLGDQDNIAPDGVGYSAATSHDAETIQAQAHPYVTGVGFGGEPLSSADFDAWQPTDRGILTNLPAEATTVLTNSDGASWVEYRHGDGRVIVTTLTYCTSKEPKSQQAAARNLLRYSRFYSGAAFTPAPTVTPAPPTPTATPVSPTATFTPTLPPTDTATATSVPPPTATPTVPELPTATEAASPMPSATVTPTAPACVGDCNGNNAVTVDEILAMVNIAFDELDVTACEAGDINHNGSVSIDEILIAVANALNACPTPSM